MKNKIITMLALILLAMPFVCGQSDTLGTFKQFECINLIQTCSNCTYVNISSIFYPDSNKAIGESAMTKIGTVYNYSFCESNYLGIYTVNGHGNIDGIDQVWSYTFDITPSGNSQVLGMFIIFIVLAYVILLIGIFTKNIPVTILGGFATMILGLYTLNNGIDVYRNFATEAFSILTMAFGGFWAAKAGLEQLDWLD